MRGFTIIRDGISMIVTPVPALYKENDTSWSISKNGYFSFEFIPMIKEVIEDS